MDAELAGIFAGENDDICRVDLFDEPGQRIVRLVHRCTRQWVGLFPTGVESLDQIDKGFADPDQDARIHTHRGH